MRKSRIRIFLEKRGYFGTHPLNLEKTWLILMFSFTVKKRGFIWAEKSVFYLKKGGSFWTEKSVFYRENEVVLS